MLEYQANMLHGPLQALGEDEDLVQVNKHEPAQCVAEDVISQILEHCRCISETEMHNKIFKMASRCLECSLPLVFLADTHQVICIVQVQFRKDGSWVERAESTRARGYLFLIMQGGGDGS